MKKSGFILILMFGLGSLACTLSTTSGPPTLVPRATEPPPPTIGYATLSPTQLPNEAATPISAPALDAGLLSLVNQVEADRLMSHVRALQNMSTRHVNSTQSRDDYGIGAASRYIEQQFRQIEQESQGDLIVFLQEFPLTYAGVDTTQTNVIAFVSGTEQGAGTIVVGAHYDSIASDFEDALAYAPGANDNASGVAALIEMARILSKRPHRSTIMFVAFSAEEVGRKGSEAFVRDYVQDNNIELQAYINVDSVGTSTNGRGVVNDRQLRVFSEGPNETSRSRQIARAANLIGFNYVQNMEIVVQDSIDRPGRYGDHFSFQEAGYPALRFIEMVENNTYRDETDTVEGINPDYLRRATQTVLAVLTTLADGPRPPQNITLRDNNDGTQTLIWEAVPGASGYVVGLRRPNSLIYDQQFETGDTNVRWDGFRPADFAGLAIAAKDSNGLMGPLSREVFIN